MGKVVLVTGASSGVGKAVAEYLGQKGYKVYGASRSGGINNLFTSVKLDVTNEDMINTLVGEIIRQEGRIDVVFNNAGIGAMGAFENSPIENLHKTFDTNVYGVARICRAVLPHMRRQEDGYIINVSSIGSVMGLPFRPYYSASKAAVDILTETIRLEVARFGIKVCLVHPGDVDTPIKTRHIVADPEGDDVYGPLFKASYAKLDNDNKNGLSPETFGPVIEKIIHSKKVKRNYYVGSAIQKLSVKLKKLLPYYLWEKIIMSYYKAD